MATNFEVTDASAPTQTDLEKLTTSPKRVRTDEGTVEERDIKDVIAGDQYNETKAAVAAGMPWGISVARIMPSSALGGQPCYPNNGLNSE